MNSFGVFSGSTQDPPIFTEQRRKTRRLKNPKAAESNESLYSNRLHQPRRIVRLLYQLCHCADIYIAEVVILIGTDRLTHRRRKTSYPSRQHFGTIYYHSACLIERIRPATEVPGRLLTVVIILLKVPSLLHLRRHLRERSNDP